VGGLERAVDVAGGVPRFFGRAVAMNGTVSFAGDSRFSLLVSLYSTATLASYDCAKSDYTDCVESSKVEMFGTYKDVWASYLKNACMGYRFAECPDTLTGTKVYQEFNNCMAYTFIGYAEGALVSLRRRFAQDDRAISEVIGFILSFALSAVFLMIAMSSFYAARNNTDGVVAASELKSVADRVASRIVEAGLVGQEFANASINLTIVIPQAINGHPYQVLAKSTGVWVNATDAPYSGMASVFKVDAITGVNLTGLAYSSNEHVIVQYSYQPLNALPLDIHIRGD